MIERHTSAMGGSASKDDAAPAKVEENALAEGTEKSAAAVEEAPSAAAVEEPAAGEEGDSRAPSAAAEEDASAAVWVSNRHTRPDVQDVNEMMVADVYVQLWKGTGRDQYFKYDPARASVLDLKLALVSEADREPPPSTQMLFMTDEHGGRTKILDEQLLAMLPKQQCLLEIAVVSAEVRLSKYY